MSVMGLEWCPEGQVRFRILKNYHHGFNPYGRFFNQMIERLGIGFYLAFQARDIERK